MDLSHLSNARILIVDDNPTNVMLLHALLNQNGFTHLDSTTDPTMVMDMYESFQPDLMLLDLQMPMLDGFAILELLHDRLSKDEFFPVLVLTADVGSDAKHRALATGASDFVTKPFDHDEVLLRVRNLLDMRFMHLRLKERLDAAS